METPLKSGALTNSSGGHEQNYGTTHAIQVIKGTKRDTRLKLVEIADSNATVFRNRDTAVDLKRQQTVQNLEGRDKI